MPWLTKDSILTFKDTNGNILSTKDIRWATEIGDDLKDGEYYSNTPIVAFYKKFMELTSKDWKPTFTEEELSTIVAVLNKVTNNDKQLNMFFLIQLAKDGNRYWNTISKFMSNENSLISYITWRLLNNPASVNQIINTLWRWAKGRIEGIRKDFEKTQEERWYDPEYYNIIQSIMPNVTKENMRRAVTKSYELASRQLVEDAIFNRIQQKIEVRSDLSEVDKARLWNTIAWVYNFIIRPSALKWWREEYLWTEEDFKNSIDEIINMNISNWDVVKQFVSNNHYLCKQMRK